MKIHWFHTWSKWSLAEYQKNVTPFYGEMAGQKLTTVCTVQQRVCAICGKQQVVKLLKN